MVSAVQTKSKVCAVLTKQLASKSEAPLGRQVLPLAPVTHHVPGSQPTAFCVGVSPAAPHVC